MSDHEIPESEPNRELWEKLLRSRPGARGAQSKEERDKKRKANLKFYEDHPHPKTAPPKRQKDKEVLGNCRICGKGIFTPELADLGIGSDCLRREVEAGRIVVEDGKYVQKRHRKRRR